MRVQFHVLLEWAQKQRALRAGLIWARDAVRFLVFRSSYFRGAYESFREAEAAASPATRIGYNYGDLARKYQADLELNLDNFEYPVLYHLGRILTEHCTVLDIGGNIGTHFLRYRKYLNLETVRWIVCDLPEITKVGQEACAGMPSVEFINDIDEVARSRVDVLLASDSLQYIESHDALLRRLIARGLGPRHLLIDQLPLYDGRRFVTLQNGGPVQYPQYVFNRADYLTFIAHLGYDLLDAWHCRNFACIVPFHPDKTVRPYTGLYFRERSLKERCLAADAVSSVPRAMAKEAAA